MLGLVSRVDGGNQCILLCQESVVKTIWHWQTTASFPRLRSGLDFHQGLFVFCVIYGYCVTFGETASHFSEYPIYSRMLVIKLFRLLVDTKTWSKSRSGQKSNSRANTPFTLQVVHPVVVDLGQNSPVVQLPPDTHMRTCDTVVK